MRRGGAGGANFAHPINVNQYTALCPSSPPQLPQRLPPASCRPPVPARITCKPHVDLLFTMSFTEDDEVALINVVRNYPLLYDTQHPEYRNIPHKERIWQTVAEEIGKPMDECRRKWKFIRDGYQRFKKTHSLECESTPILSKVKRHNQLMFLDSVFRPRKSRRTRAGESSPLSCDQTDHAEEPITIVKEEIVAVTYDDNDQLYFEEEDEYTHTDDNITEERDVEPRSRTVKRKYSYNENTVDKKREVTCRESASGTEKKDDVEYFCLHIAEVLRKLPPVTKAKAKKHLNEVLSDYEILAATATCAVETPSTSCNSN